MKKIKLALVGCAGRMGQQIIKELQNFSNIYLIAALENKNSKFQVQTCTSGSGSVLTTKFSIE